MGDKEASAARREAYDPASLDGRADRIRTAFTAAHPSPPDGMGMWPVEVYDDAVIVMDGDRHLRYPVTVDGDTITFGEPVEVEPRVGYDTTVEAIHAPVTPVVSPATLIRLRETGATRILEAADDEGWKWRVIMVTPGTSKNRTRYRREVLAEAVGRYEGAKAFDGHRTTSERNSSRVGNMVGWHEGVSAVAESGALTSTFTIARSAPTIRDLFRSAFEAGRPDLIGFSHDVSAETRTVLEGGVPVVDVTKIAEVHSVDIVADPSAGGQLQRLVASSQGGIMIPDELKALLDGNEELMAVARAHTAATTVATPVAAAVTTAPAAVATVTEALSGIGLRLVVREALIAHAPSIPEARRAAFAEKLTGPMTEDEVVAKVKEAADLWSAIAGSVPGALPGQPGGSVTVTEAEADKHAKALDGFFAGKAVDGQKPFRTLKEAYAVMTGRTPAFLATEDVARRILAESVGAVASPEHRRLMESLTSTSWASALGDSITRRAIADYQTANFGDWRKFVSEVVPVTDFRSQKRDRVGYYNVLSTVAEGATYPALTSPADEEATYGVTKKGGTDDLTWEMIANDDIGAIRAIPRKLGRAAALTIARAIFVTILEGNPAIYDGVTLFHATSHGANTSAVAFASAGLNTARNVILSQTIPGETSGVLGAVPKWVLYPPELFATVWGVLNPAPGRTTETPWAGLEAIECPLFTDANDWYLVAEGVPTIEVGFLNGQEDPEIFVQDAPTVGSVFTADKVTYKVRHVWGLAVLDFRGFYKGTQT